MEYMANLPAIIKAGNSNGRRHSSRRHFRCGVCAAALRAMTAARVYLIKGENITLEEVAARHGASVQYVRAAIMLIKSKDQPLIDSVMLGNVPILTAAKQAAPLAMMLTAYGEASAKNKDDFFVATGCTNDLGKQLITTPPAERTKGAMKFGDAEAIWTE